MNKGRDALVFLLIRAVSCIPFHSVNTYDIHGGWCKALTDTVACPSLLCVQNQTTDCPPAFGPGRCAELFGPQYRLCIDGYCRIQCNEGLDKIRPIKNPCACAETPTESYQVACLRFDNISIPVSKYIDSKNQSFIELECAKKLNFSLNAGNAYTQAVCNVPSESAPRFQKEFFIPFYCIWIICGIMVCIWYILKKRLEERYLVSRWPSKSKSALYIYHYKTHWMGSIVRTLCLVSCFSMIVGLIFIILDQYSILSFRQYTLFDGSYEAGSATFILFWHLNGLFLLCLIIYRSDISTFFMIETSGSEASFVMIEKAFRQNLLCMGRSSSFIDKFLRFEELLANKFRLTEKTIIAVIRDNTTPAYFTFESHRFILNEENVFVPDSPYVITDLTRVQEKANGLSLKKVHSIQSRLGPNFISVKVPSFYEALLEEIQSVFYLYQIQCIWVYLVFNYYYIGILQTTVIILSAVVKVGVGLSALRKVKGMAEHKMSCSLLRDDKWIPECTTSMVPGDVFKVQPGEEVPCDAVLISGEVVVNEASLTGEPLSIRKFPPANLFESPEFDKKNTLYAGTRILQSFGNDPRDGDSVATALVIRTGTQTDKGKLVSDILHPVPITFIFDIHLKIILVFLFIWGAWWFAWSIYLMGRGNITSWFYGIFLLSEIISPLIPAALVVGQTVSASRLKSQGIFCTNFHRIMVAGKVKIFAFDKTGTLTREGLDFYGVHQISDGQFESERCSHDFNHLVHLALGTCHSVIQSNGEMLGNPVDVEMFRSSGWSFCQDYLTSVYNNQSIKFRTLLRHEFQHSRQSMSVIVQNMDTNHCFAFIKGSFEVLQQMACSVPKDYIEQAHTYARKGVYVLALGYHDLGILSQENLVQMSRQTIESNIKLLGLVLFKNELRKDTKESLMLLQNGGCKNVMITGDNVLTAIQISLECGMIPKDKAIFLGDLGLPSNNYITWTNTQTLIEIPESKVLQDGVIYALTGKAFQHLYSRGEIHKYMKDARIFARMTPSDKVACVEELMKMDVTAMCGDGGNDCGALKAASIGVALSETEASAVAPFSTNRKSIMACVQVLKEGRCALANSFASFKFLIMYGGTMVILEMTQFYFSVIASQFIWIAIDSLITILLSWTITLAKPAHNLSQCRPTARLLSWRTVGSILIQFVVNSFFVIVTFVLLYSQEWFRCHEFDSNAVDTAKWWLLADNFEAEILGIMVMFQFINAAAICNFGYKFRQSWANNYALVSAYIVELAFVSFLLLADPNPMSCFFRVNCGSKHILEELGYRVSWDIADYSGPLGHNVLPVEFRYKLFALAAANCGVTILLEKFVILNK